MGIKGSSVEITVKKEWVVRFEGRYCGTDKDCDAESLTEDCMGTYCTLFNEELESDEDDDGTENEGLWVRCQGCRETYGKEES